MKIGGDDNYEEEEEEPLLSSAVVRASKSPSAPGIPSVDSSSKPPITGVLALSVAFLVVEIHMIMIFDAQRDFDMTQKA